MIISFITLVSVSKLAYYLFDNEILGEKYDFLGVLERRRNLSSRKGKRGEDDALPLQEKYNGFDDPTPQKI